MTAVKIKVTKKVIAMAPPWSTPPLAAAELSHWFGSATKNYEIPVE